MSIPATYAIGQDRTVGRSSEFTVLQAFPMRRAPGLHKEIIGFPDEHMRPELSDPADQDKFKRVLPLTEAVLHLHEAGQNYEAELQRMSRLLGRIVGKPEVLAAFGSADAEAFARRLAIDWQVVPTDLSAQELLELFDAVCAALGDPVHIEYWVRCLELNTGDERISDLIFWPDEYFGAGYDGRELAPVEMLEVALRKRSAK